MFNLLGETSLTAGETTTPLPLTRPSWLLIYLAYYGDWLTRQQLAFFFRPDADDASARHYLRKLIAAAKGLPGGEALELDGQRLRLRLPTDVARFRAAKKAGNWAQAYALYGGAFAAGLDASDSLSYDEWLSLEREALRNDFLTVALNHANDLERTRQYSAAAEVGRTMLRTEELSEAGACVYARNTFLQGHRAPALTFLEAFIETFQEEIGLEVSEETSRLRANLVAGEVTPAKEDALTDLLTTPGVRLLSLNADPKGEVVITQRVSQADALGAVVGLIDHLLTEGHRGRAADLARDLLEHPACTQAMQQRLTQMLPTPHVTLRARATGQAVGVSF